MAPSKSFLQHILFLDEDSDRDFISFVSNASAIRGPKWVYDRMDWERDLARLRHTRQFQSTYHMSERSFDRLVDLLRPKLPVNIKQSMNSSSGGRPITPEMKVAIGLRFLGGEHIKSLADIFGISRSSVTRSVGLFLDAVVTTPKLNINMPLTNRELQHHADGWGALSSADGVFDGCVGAIDGWLCCIEKPSVKHPADYFSGHYQRYGINIQAICDSKLRFIFFGVVGTGRTNDGRAFGKCMALRRWLENLPDEYFIVGDNAYTLNCSLLIPFSGGQRHEEYNLTYNFYLSQLRIRIEMAFGRLTTKFRIFRRNLDFSLQKSALICEAAARLHNFVIDNDDVAFRPGDSPDDMGIDPLGKVSGWRAAVTCDEKNNGFLPATAGADKELEFKKFADSRRVEFVNELKSREMDRPYHNKVRNGEIIK